eukprot:Amastigsp_a177268_7.p3 type:complete len:118 gc:universal Amastigsp_a177268_7:1152-799(-)
MPLPPLRPRNFLSTISLSAATPRSALSPPIRSGYAELMFVATCMPTSTPTSSSSVAAPTGQPNFFDAESSRFGSMPRISSDSASPCIGESERTTRKPGHDLTTMTVLPCRSPMSTAV